MISAITSVVGRGFVVAAGGCVDVGNGSIVPRRKIQKCLARQNKTYAEQLLSTKSLVSLR